MFPWPAGSLEKKQDIDMRFIINSQLLLENLQSISSLLTENKALPILEKCLFRLENSKLTMVASDSESVAVVDIPLDEANGEGAIAVPARQLMDTVKTIADMPIVFDIDLNTSSIDFSAGTGQFKLVGEPAETYPEIPQMDSGDVSLKIQSDILTRAISKTIFATGNDQLRPAMCGVFFEMKPDGVTFVATDAHKLVRYRRSDVFPVKERSFVVPKKALMLLKNMLSLHKDPVEVNMDANEKNVFFSFGNVHVSCRLIDGRYPNYEAVIPKDNPNKLAIERAPFLGCIRRACIFSSKAMPQIRLSLSAATEMVVLAEDIDSSSAAKERLACQYEGEPMEIGFNARYFLEMLNNVETNDICLEMSSPSRAGIILPVSENAEGEDLLMLVMPVMLN